MLHPRRLRDGRDGQSAQYDDTEGTLFLQQEDGTFVGVVSRTIGPARPNVVSKQFQDQWYSTSEPGLEAQALFLQAQAN